MTENNQTDHDKDWKSYIKASQNVDACMLEIVRLLARRAARDDLEKIQCQENNKTLH